MLAFSDPRTSFMGVRILCGEGSLEIDSPDIKLYDNGDEKEYNLIRYLNAVAESSIETANHFPQHLNFN